MCNLKKMKFLVGNKLPIRLSLEPFNELVFDFLNDLSIELLRFKELKKYSDIATYAFYSRKNNLLKLKDSLEDNFLRKGKGTILHISPSNVPINFAYSFLFSIISGNSNIVRVPSKNFNQVEIICNHINKIFKKKKYQILKKSNLFVRYDKDDSINKSLSLFCDGRMIWGGDKTINEFKNFKTKINSSDILFRDKYSISLINSDELLKKKEKIFYDKLAENFYNDTLIIDQNACSSPHIILWKGKKNIKAQKLFWKSFLNFSKKKYQLEDMAISEKFTFYSKDLMNNKNIKSVENYDNLLMVAKLKKLPSKSDDLRGKWGYFYETNISRISNLKKIVNNKFQTITYYGFKKLDLTNFIRNNNIEGIDRIVPIGKAMDIGMIWDGYNLKDNLTRIIDIR
jgi:hypothetical protein